ncbi:MAG: hypothetical protein JXQ76_07315, partial [Campylobacterales bacterium]|nr:hypothetical protein [Campylobacterales bacterium]
FNLNWNHKANHSQSNSLFNKIKNKLSSSDLDLDLGCMYRLKNGQKGVVQALGNSFGSLSNAPFILLDGDDRSGANKAGETLHFSKIEEIDLAIVFAFIYEGAPNWKEASGIATVKQPNASDIIIQLNDSSSKTMVGIAILRNENSSLKVEKLEKYYSGHKALDDDFGFGFRWTAGSK